MNSHFCIIFAGAVGTSKTPTSNFLSINLGLPIFNNDAIRSEVIEDIGFLDKAIHLKRRNERLLKLIQSQRNFILDASIDRVWSEIKPTLEKNNYMVIIISFNLSKPLLEKLYKAKSYDDSLKRIDNLIDDHKKFLDNHSNEVNLHINDDNFSDRLELSYHTVKKIIEHKQT